MQTYLEGLLQTLGEGPEHSPPVRIFLLDRPEPQADLLSGRILRFNLGLLLALESEAELAFVLAHELAHRDLRHDAARRRAGWDALEAEEQADLAAASTLARLGYPGSTGIVLLRRLHRASTEPDARAQLASRVAAISAIAATAHAPAPSRLPDRERFERHVAPYRARGTD